MLMQDMIHVVESKPGKRYGDYFLRQIVKVRAYNFIFMTIISRVGGLYFMIIYFFFDSLKA